MGVDGVLDVLAWRFWYRNNLSRIGDELVVSFRVFVVGRKVLLGLESNSNSSAREGA